MKDSWRELSTKFCAEVCLPNQDNLGAGHLMPSVSTRWFVRINAGPEGLIVKRCPFSFMYPHLGVAWVDIATVTEYASGIREGFKSAKGQTNALLTFKHAMMPDLMVPWCIEFNQFLPSSVGYIDHKDRNWSIALSKMQTMRNN